VLPMYSLSFAAFSVEFVVDDAASREATASLKHSVVAPDTVRGERLTSDQAP
jgi:hypothetical protein